MTVLSEEQGKDQDVQTSLGAHAPL